MKTSQAGIDLIKRSEGLKLKPYADPAGFQTIGYGHKIRAHEDFSAGITAEQAELILADDVKVAEFNVSRLVKVQVTQGQFDALVDFTFNLGAGRLERSHLLELLNEGKQDEAALQLRLWVHAGEAVLPGLVTRRAAEYELWKGKA